MYTTYIHLKIKNLKKNKKFSGGVRESTKRPKIMRLRRKGYRKN